MRKKLIEIKVIGEGARMFFEVPHYVTEIFFESLPDDKKLDFIKKREQKYFEEKLGKDWKKDWKNKLFIELRYECYFEQ